MLRGVPRSNLQRRVAIILSLTLIVAFARPVDAAGGTDHIAEKGKRVAGTVYGWPAGLEELLNDPARTDGWQPWFTELPSDVRYYDYEINTMGELNRVIARLAEVKADLRQIHLSYERAPQELGRVRGLPEKKQISVVVSFGSQAQLDQWYARVPQRAEDMELVFPRQALPLTLTVYVQNEFVKLDELKIQDGLRVTGGLAPTLFHRSKTMLDQLAERELAEESAAWQAKAKAALDAPSRNTLEKIEAYLEKRNTISKPVPLP